MKCLSLIGFICINCLTIAFGEDTKVSQLLDSASLSLRSQQFAKSESFLQAVYRELEKSPQDSLFIEAKILEARYWLEFGTYERGLEALNEAQQTYHTSGAQSVDQQVFLLHTQGALNSRLGKHQESLEIANRLYEFVLCQDTINKRHELNALALMGTAYFQLYNPERALKINEQVLQKVEALFSPEHPHVAGALNNVATACQMMQRYDKALLMLFRAINIREKMQGPDNLELQRLHFNIGVCLQRQEKYEEAISHFQEAIRITEIHLPGHQFIAEDFRRMGECQRALGDHELALANFEQALQIYLNRDQSSNFSIAEVYRSFALIYGEDGNYQKAIACTRKAEKVAAVKIGDAHPWISTYLREIALYQSRMGDFAAAKNTIKRCKDILQIADENDIAGLSAKTHAYSALTIAGEIYFQSYQAEGQEADLFASLADLSLGIKILDHVRQGLREENSKYLLDARNIDIYEQAILTATKLYEIFSDEKYLLRAIEYSELSRRSTVMESILSHNTAAFPNVPEGILIRERSFQKQISDIQNLAIENFDDYQKREQNPDLDDRLFALHTQYNELVDSIEAQYPAYYRYRYVHSPPDIRSIQRVLEPDQIIVEYFDGEEDIFAFGITADNLMCTKIKKSDSFFADLKGFQTHLNNPDSILFQIDRSFNRVKTHGYNLYTKLLQPFLKMEQVGDILIIPDGLEVTVPFETMSSEENPESDFLFARYNLHYAQSMLTWQEQSNLQPVSRQTFAGWAPDYQSSIIKPDTFDQPLFAMIVRQGEMQLPGATHEVTTIAKMLQGQTFIGPQATERNLLKHIEDFQILHLSAHAVLNNDYPSLSKFLMTVDQDTIYDGALTASEICHLKLTAELAVLSACHTGMGKINRGEGVMSLGRAFAFAGVPATVSSLWKIPDHTTSQLLPYFYQALKNGLDKAAALNQARLDFLNNISVNDYQHPYYWAGFVLYGNTNPLQLKKSKSWGQLYLPASMLLLGLIWLAIRFKQFRKS